MSPNACRSGGRNFWPRSRESFLVKVIPSVGRGMSSSAGAGWIRLDYVPTVRRFCTGSEWWAIADLNCGPLACQASTRVHVTSVPLRTWKTRLPALPLMLPLFFPLTCSRRRSGRSPRMTARRYGTCSRKTARRESGNPHAGRTNGRNAGRRVHSVTRRDRHAARISYPARLCHACAARTNETSVGKGW